MFRIRGGAVNFSWELSIQDFGLRVQGADAVDPRLFDPGPPGVLRGSWDLVSRL